MTWEDKTKKENGSKGLQTPDPYHSATVESTQPPQDSTAPQASFLEASLVCVCVCV